MNPKTILSSLRHPDMVRQMGVPRMERLCGEIREVLLETVSQTGGHLASNLGVVELTVALLHTFSPATSRFVWDVGHQCYPYKLLTGRYDRFDTLRQPGGLSGFPKTAESPYDSFVAGHASTSLAVAFGLKRAMTLQGRRGQVIAVVGDGAFTGGMVYEGLNNIGKSGENLIVILNDNEMSISKSEGALAKYLAVIRGKPGYFRAKEMTKQFLSRIPVAGNLLYDLADSSKTALKQMIYPSTFFEDLGFTYFGPVDGHDLQALCDVLQQAGRNDGPSFVHVQTQKGKGYAFAEKNPGAYHGVGKFDLAAGQEAKPESENFSAVFGHELAVLGKQDARICAITAAMEHGTGLQYFARAFKSSGRYYDVGIAEEFAVTFGAALQAGGTLPVLAVYSTFLQRGYDQLLHDVAIEPRHLVLAIDRAGIVGDDGETHQGIFDAAFLSTVPGMTLLAPANYAELRGMLRAALYDYTGPVALRYPRGGEPEQAASLSYTPEPYALFGKGSRVIVTYGRTVAAALQAAALAGNTAVLKLNRVLPLPAEAVQAAAKFKTVLFAEEGIAAGGIGMQFIAALALAGYRGKTLLHAIEGFVPQAPVPRALQQLGLDAQGLAALLDTRRPRNTAKEKTI